MKSATIVAFRSIEQRQFSQIFRVIYTLVVVGTQNLTAEPVPTLASKSPDTSLCGAADSSLRAGTEKLQGTASYEEMHTTLFAYVVRSLIVTLFGSLTPFARLTSNVATKWLGVILPAGALLLTACSVSAQQEVQRVAASAIAASRVAQNCRSLVGGNPSYQRLAARMPLASVFDATLSQMSDPSFADRHEVASLGLWLKDVEKCRDQVFDITLSDFPTALSVLVANWNKDDETFVLLAARKLAWGKAIMRIRANHAEMLSALSRQALEISQQASAERQAELTRRVALLSALTNLVP